MKFTPLTKDRLNHLAEIGEATDYSEALQQTEAFKYVGETDSHFINGNVYEIAITGFDDNGNPIGAFKKVKNLNPHHVDFFRVIHSDWVELSDYTIKEYLSLIDEFDEGEQ